jgi:hypothetical protein
MLTLRRAVALVATILALVLVATASAQAVTRHSPGGRGASWLAGQLHHGLMHNRQYDFDDYGLTADTALALTTLGHQQTAVDHIRHALARHVADYTTYKHDVYAGPVAKLLVVSQATGGSQRHFGGVDLVSRLERRVSATAPTVGRLEDKSSTDFANTIGQIFAVRGLTVAGSTKAPAALAFLLEQQCPGGYFRLSFATSKTAANQGCRPSDSPDTDATALAVVELWQLRTTDPALQSSLTSAVTWLRKQQKANGSLGGGTTTAASNANSTGLAGWAFGLAGRCVPAQHAAEWVKARQVGGHLAGTPLAGERGAIAYDNAGLRAAEKHGIVVSARDQFRRATAQAAPALAYLHGCRTR